MSNLQLANFPIGLRPEMSDRQLIGLPDHYFPDALRQFDWGRLGGLATLAPDRLTEIAEDASAPVADRIAAGSVLGWRGDPRIVLGSPKMVSIGGATARIGSSDAEIDEAFRLYKKLGVERCWLEKEWPLHSVALRSYALMKYLVTNIEYRAFLEATGYPEIPTSWQFGRDQPPRTEPPLKLV